MSTVTAYTGEPLSSAPESNLRLLAAIWLVATAVAVFFALLMDASTTPGANVPVGNDSFYHARRIIDTAETGTLYQFDERIHAPEGAWIPWPWGYDYLMGWATRIATTLVPGLQPMAFIAYVPTFWLLVNAALFLGAASALRLSLEMRALAMLCFALSPLTQLLHSVGTADHHFVEHSFVLLTVWLGLRWFDGPTDSRRAAHLALALGTAPAFHNGLFILQLLPLATVFLAWTKGTAPQARTLYVFAAVLVSATLCVLLPSTPFREGMFEFGLLSWFHLYAACCTAIAMAFMGWHPFSRGGLAGLAVLCAALTAPLASQLLSGAGFLSGSFSVLDQITEVQSPYELGQRFGIEYAMGYYSWLLPAAPLLLAYFAFRLMRERGPSRIYFASVTVLGLALMLSQFRFHYFGFFPFVAAGLVVIDHLRTRFDWHRGGVFALTFGAIALAYQPALRERLFTIYAPGAEPAYAAAQAIYAELDAACATDPGVVLADTDDGNAILFHSDCSVIANNFILRPEDQRHIDEIAKLMQSAPATVRAERPDIRYIFLRTESFSVPEGDEMRIVESNPMARQLLVDPEPPQGFELLRTVYRGIDEDGPRDLYARLYKVSPVRGQPDVE